MRSESVCVGPQVVVGPVLVQQLVGLTGQPAGLSGYGEPPAEGLTPPPLELAWPAPLGMAAPAHLERGSGLLAPRLPPLEVAAPSVQ